MVALSSAWTSLLYTVSFVWPTVQVNEQYDTENTTNTPLQYTQQPVKKHAPELEIPTVLAIKKKLFFQKKKNISMWTTKTMSNPLKPKTWCFATNLLTDLLFYMKLLQF